MSQFSCGERLAPNYLACPARAAHPHGRQDRRLQMKTDQSDDQTFIVYRDDESILMTWNTSQQGARGQVITSDVWRAVFPIALAHDPVRLMALTTMKIGDALDVGFSEDMRALYSLLAILVATGSPTRAAEIARTWIKLPMETRVRWRHDADCDKPIHAQILGATSGGDVTLDSLAPDWLFKLVKASRGWSVVRDDDGLHWTSAKTPLGSSCIAWADDDEESPQACLAISDCGVQVSRADDPGLALAMRAVTMLVNALGTLVGNPEIADDGGLDSTGHDAMELYEILQSWIQRLTSAAEAARALGLSTTETWEWIRRDGARVAG
jgi:hypothetical protein